MSTAWLLDLTADTLDVEFTIDDLMADLEPNWNTGIFDEVEQ